MRKRKGVEPKFAVVLALAIVLVLVWYGYKADWFKNIGESNNLGAVAAVSSNNGKLISGAKAANSGNASSPTPVIAVTAWPTFELKYDNKNEENNLVVKAEYSITAQGGKIFVPLNWNLLELKNTLDQYGHTSKIETKALDAVVTSTCMSIGPCYEIPAGKTIRFTLRQVYNPSIMFGGIYTAKLNYYYYSTDPKNWDSFFYKQFPAQTSKIASVTVVGEKSPYVYTTVINITPGQQFTVKGVRLTGTTPVLVGSTALANIISRSDTEMVLSFKETPGAYTLYFKHPTYGESNKAQITVTPVPGVNIVYPKGGESWPIGSRQAIKWENGSLADGAYVIYLSLLNKETGQIHPLSSGGNLRTPTSIYSFNVPLGVPEGNFYVANIEARATTGSTKFTDVSDGYVKITPPNTTCPQVIIIEGAQYTLSPCQINATMIDGQGDVTFSTNIIPKNNTSYGFGVYGYGVGFPTYGILGIGAVSGSTSGTTTLKLKFSDQILSANGTSPKTYTGYLPIGIYHGSANGSQISYLNLNVNLTVNPSGQGTSTPVSGVDARYINDSFANVPNLDTTTTDDQGRYTMDIEVTAVGETSWIALTAAKSMSSVPSGAGAFLFMRNSSNAAVTTGTTTATLERVTGGSLDGNYVRINAGQTARLKMTAYYDPSASGLYNLQAYALNFNQNSASAGDKQYLFTPNTFQTRHGEILN